MKSPTSLYPVPIMEMVKRNLQSRWLGTLLGLSRGCISNRMRGLTPFTRERRTLARLFLCDEMELFRRWDGGISLSAEEVRRKRGRKPKRSAETPSCADQQGSFQEGAAV